MKDFDKKISIESEEELDLRELSERFISSNPNILVVGELRGEELQNLIKKSREHNCIIGGISSAGTRRL